MICHMCGELAIGQCQHCGRHYCKQHGNITCVACAEGVQKRPSEPTPQLDLRHPRYPRDEDDETHGEDSGGACAWCKEPAIGRCARCSEFCCIKHRGASSIDDFTLIGLFERARFYCKDCQSVREMQAILIPMIAFILLSAIAVIVTVITHH
jgi:hypothetical protein